MINYNFFSYNLFHYICLFESVYIFIKGFKKQSLNMLLLIINNNFYQPEYPRLKSKLYLI
jgi:hypothetical protein